MSNSFLPTANAVVTGNISGSISASYYNSVDGYSIKRSQSADLPAIVIQTYDEHDSAVTMTLAPEGNISPADATKIMMLMVAVMGSGTAHFNPLNYVKKHNLERHFTYS